jgi:predicted DNA binding CopG/RHH family protein
MKKKLPKLETDEEAEEFVTNADLTEYDLSQLRTVLFEFQPKTERVNMRLPKTLLDAVKESVDKAGVPYQRFIRQFLKSAIRSSAGSQQR